MPRPKRTKPDANQAEIVAELRELGYDVLDVHNLDEDDIIVFGAKAILTVYCGVGVEIKSETGKLSPEQEKRIEDSNGSRIVARNVKDITDWFGRE